MFKWLKDLVEFKPKGRYLLILQAVSEYSPNAHFFPIYQYMKDRHWRHDPSIGGVHYYLKRLVAKGYLTDDEHFKTRRGIVTLYELTPKAQALLQEHSAIGA